MNDDAYGDESWNTYRSRLGDQMVTHMDSRTHRQRTREKERKGERKKGGASACVSETRHTGDASRQARHAVQTV